MRPPDNDGMSGGSDVIVGYEVELLRMVHALRRMEAAEFPQVIIRPSPNLIWMKRFGHEFRQRVVPGQRVA